MRRLELSQGRYAIVSDCDYATARQYKWSFCSSHGYAVRTTSIRGGKKKKLTILLHRWVAARMGHSCHYQVDHRNRNKLDCRRCNLRAATPQQNRRNRAPTRANTTGYKGVFRNASPTNPFTARIVLGNGIRRSLGNHRTAKEAAKAYNMAAKKHFGRFAWLNPV